MKQEIENLNWITGSGNKSSLQEISELIKKSIESGAKIYIGTDSFVAKGSVTFASAICLYQKGVISKYYYSRTKKDKDKYGSLINRLLEETRKSIEIGTYFSENCKINSRSIELHLDVSPIHLKNATSRFSDMLKAYATGHGFKCKIKPNAWASQSVADKHSK